MVVCEWPLDNAKNGKRKEGDPHIRSTLPSKTMLGQSSPNSDCRIPRGRTNRCPIRACPQTRDPILMPIQYQLPNTLQRVPDAHAIVTVTGKEDPACVAKIS